MCVCVCVCVCVRVLTRETTYALHHTTPREIARCLRPGGCLLIRESDVVSADFASFETIAHKCSGVITRAMRVPGHPKRNTHNPCMVPRVCAPRAAWHELMHAAGLGMHTTTEAEGLHRNFHAVYVKTPSARIDFGMPSVGHNLDCVSMSHEECGTKRGQTRVAMDKKREGEDEGVHPPLPKYTRTDTIPSHTPAHLNTSTAAPTPPPQQSPYPESV